MGKRINLLSPNYQRKLRKAFVGANILLILFGVVQVICVTTLEGLDDIVIEFMQTNTDYNNDHEYLLYTSSGLIILVGLFGVLCTFYDCPVLFDSYDSVLHIAFALTVMAAITPELISSRPEQEEMESLFKAEAFHHAQDMHRRDIWGEMTHNWYPLQQNLQCCGVNDFRDWLFSRMSSIPVSCCKRKHLKECTSYLVTPDSTETRINSSDPIFEGKIYPLITHDGCLASLQTVIKNIKSRWIKYPLAFLICYVLLMGWAVYFAHMIRLVADTVEDLATLHSTHHQLKLLIQDKAGDSASYLEVPELFISSHERKEQETGPGVNTRFLHRNTTTAQDGKKCGAKLEKWDAESH